MADTIREQIIQSFLTRLAVWTFSNGFNHDCGLSVRRAQEDIDLEDMPVVILWPEAETVESDYGDNICTMPLSIEAFAEYGTINQSIIQEQLLGDAIKIMTDPSVTITSKIDSILYIKGGAKSVPQNQEYITAIYANFEVKYITKIGNPYIQ